MSLTAESTTDYSQDNGQLDPRRPGMLAQTTYDELRAGGFTDTDIMAFAGELLSLVATDVRNSNG